MRKTLSILLISFIILNIAGCEGLRRKFTPKKKTPTKMPRIYQVKKYEKKPTPELYNKHYAFWASWQSELIKVLGENHKKDMRCIDEIVGNLYDMQNIMVKEKADKLQPHIDKMAGLRDAIFNEELTHGTKDNIRRTLEREERAIKREFSYSKVKDYLKKNFDE